MSQLITQTTPQIPSTILHRARQAGQKQERRQVILNMAAQMFGETSYEAVTMSGVAERVGLVKGTLYLYFATKEELFLALTEQMLSEWFDLIEGELGELSAGQTTNTIAGLIASSLRQHGSLIRLLAILSTVLEKNIRLESAVRFKQFLRQRLLQMGDLLEAHLPFFAAGEGMQALLRIHALIVGIHHLSDPSPVIRQALNEPGMELLRVDFDTEFTASVAAMLRGMKHVGD